MKKNTLFVSVLFSLSVFFSSCMQDSKSNLESVWNVTSWFNNGIEEIGPGVTITIEFKDVNNDAGTMKITMNNPSDIFIYEGTFSITNDQLTANNLNETTGNSEIYRNDISGAITISGNNLNINGNNTAYSSTAPTANYTLVVDAEK